MGLVTVKDCLKYQFQVEAHENPKDDTGILATQERVWDMLRRISNWVGDRVGRISGGRLRLSEGASPPPSAGLSSDTGGELELADRRDAV
jgi:chloride channel 3/4/5